MQQHELRAEENENYFLTRPLGFFFVELYGNSETSTPSPQQQQELVGVCKSV